MNEIEKRNRPVPKISQNTDTKQAEVGRKFSKSERRFLIFGVSAIMLMISYILIKKTISIGADALINSYNAAYESERDGTYQEYYERFFKEGEKDYHVKNRGTISIGQLKEIGKLEVLEVSDVEFVVEDKNNNKNGITSWLEVPGKGTFVINIEEAEFIVDNERVHVLVRVPYPELTSVNIDYSNVKKRLFKNNMFNDSYSVGEDLARKQLGEGDALIKKEFASNQHYYLTAQEVGKSTIASLVRQLNPDETDLKVEVEYY